MPPPLKLVGKWNYCSFHDERTPMASSPAQLAIPWLPFSVLDARTDEAGKVTGTLTVPGGTVFGHFRRGEAVPVPLSAHYKLTHVVELTGVTGDGTEYRLRGWFTPEVGPVAGTAVCVAKDLAGQPNGTAGPFVLYPKAP